MAYAEEAEEEDDDEEDAMIQQMADVYMAATKEFAQGVEDKIYEKAYESMRAVYIADARAKRSFGKKGS